MKAVATSWKREPFEEGVAIPFELEIHKGQIERIENGLIPEEMEDKWFIYYEKHFCIFIAVGLVNLFID